jgi:hypothetical protein
VASVYEEKEKQKKIIPVYSMNRAEQQNLED